MCVCVYVCVCVQMCARLYVRVCNKHATQLTQQEIRKADPFLPCTHPPLQRPITELKGTTNIAHHFESHAPNAQGGHHPHTIGSSSSRRGGRAGSRAATHAPSPSPVPGEGPAQAPSVAVGNSQVPAAVSFVIYVLYVCVRVCVCVCVCLLTPCLLYPAKQGAALNF
jgi:hypothetical protein